MKKLISVILSAALCCTMMLAMPITKGYADEQLPVPTPTWSSVPVNPDESDEPVHPMEEMPEAGGDYL
jgi:predicted transposase YbfD/YdcC